MDKRLNEAHHLVDERDGVDYVDFLEPAWMRVLEITGDFFRETLLALHVNHTNEKGCQSEFNHF